MYQTRQVPVASPLVGSPDPLRLPLTVLLALPAYPFHDPVDRRFNLPAAVGRLLGDSFGWERATRILAPRLWTPDWDAAALRQFVLTPSLGDELPLPGSLYHLDVESLRATTFPGLEASTYPIRIGVEPPRYPVVHFVGNLGWYRNDPTLDLGAPIRPELRPGVLRDALVEAETRLLILHIPPYNASGAERLAQYLVGGGVPAVLVVQSPDLATASAYFLNLYANLIHSLLLPDVARPTPEQERAGLNASLVYGEGAESVLQLNPYLDELHGRVRRVRETLEQQRQQVSALHDTQLRLLHRDQLEALAPRLRAVQDPLATLAGAVDFEENRLTPVRWMLHESQGAVPLSESAEVVPAIERSVQALAEQYPQLVQELHTEAARAPRVLNANFALPGSGRVLGPREGLAPGRDYDLLLDVGPRWTRIPSLVVGHADFPEEALPPDREGYVVDVVLVSEDFSPQIVSGQIWVPRGVGRSIPLVNGERARPRSALPVLREQPAPVRAYSGRRRPRSGGHPGGGQRGRGGLPTDRRLPGRGGALRPSRSPLHPKRGQPGPPGRGQPDAQRRWRGRPPHCCQAPARLRRWPAEYLGAAAAQQLPNAGLDALRPGRGRPAGGAGARPAPAVFLSERQHRPGGARQPRRPRGRARSPDERQAARAVQVGPGEAGRTGQRAVRQGVHPGAARGRPLQPGAVGAEPAPGAVQRDADPGGPHQCRPVRVPLGADLRAPANLGQPGELALLPHRRPGVVGGGDADQRGAPCPLPLCRLAVDRPWPAPVLARERRHLSLRLLGPEARHQIGR